MGTLAATSADSSTGGIILIIVGIAAYFVPWFVAMLRHHPNTTAIFLIDLFTAWTGIGWVVALVMAVWVRPGQAPQPPAAPPQYGSSAYDSRGLPPPPGGYQ